MKQKIDRYTIQNGVLQIWYPDNVEQEDIDDLKKYMELAYKKLERKIGSYTKPDETIS